MGSERDSQTAAARILRTEGSSSTLLHHARSISNLSHADPHSPDGICRASLEAIYRLLAPHKGSVGTPTQVKELRPNDFVIAVLGQTGSGKSTFISTVTKCGMKIGKTLLPCTKDLSLVRVPSRWPIFGDIVFIDTPGIDEPDLHEAKILYMISDHLKKARSGVRLAGMIYLHRISDNRTAGAPMLTTMATLKKLYGEGASQNISFVTTMWDEVDEAAGLQREKDLKQNYWYLMLSLGSRLGRFIRDENPGSSLEILGPLITTAFKREEEAVQETVAKMCSSTAGSISSPHLTTDTHHDGATQQRLTSRLVGVLAERESLFEQLKERTAVDQGKDVGTLLRRLEEVQRELFSVCESVRQVKPPIGRQVRRFLRKFAKPFSS